MISPAIIARTLDLAVEIQQIPAPTFSEQSRADFVARQFRSAGLADVAIDERGNVYARLPGQGLKPPVVVSAHLDTVFPAEVDLTVRREPGKIHGPAIGDNSIGVAGLFGLLWSLDAPNGRSSLPGDVWLVANVGEEGLGNLNGMRAVVERFGDAPLAYVVLEGMALGQVYHRALGVRRYKITVTAPGGHSWVDYGRPSAVHELAHLINQLTSLPMVFRPRTTLNVGVIQGGVSVNTIAPAAWLLLDLRSEGADALQNLIARVEDAVEQANHPPVQVRAEVIGDRPSGEIRASHPLVRLARRCLKEQGLDPYLGIGSTDANIPLSLGLPAITIGLTSGEGAHTAREHIRTEPVAKGLAQLQALVQRAFREL